MCEVSFGIANSLLDVCVVFTLGWQWPTLPRRLQRSTISACGLNYRVRYGAGCTPTALVTNQICLRSSLEDATHWCTPPRPLDIQSLKISPVTHRTTKPSLLKVLSALLRVEYEIPNLRSSKQHDTFSVISFHRRSPVLTHFVRCSEFHR